LPNCLLGPFGLDLLGEIVVVAFVDSEYPVHPDEVDESNAKIAALAHVDLDVALGVPLIFS